jgi:malate dehydrogenase (oxaloacetate-decarboxylating)(NADP+)
VRRGTIALRHCAGAQSLARRRALRPSLCSPDMAKIRRKDALEYHSSGKPGKIQVVATKPLTSQRDLSLAYSPGVAEPCMEIFKNPSDVYKYTARGNLVAVISDGTAVLGLGDIGPLASKPVMEGKGVLFKKFAGIDVFDIELSADDPDKLIEVVAALEPTFGGINLEDIKSPECFYIEAKLKERMKIPVFHDDQHGTAIISGAALLNAAELQGKKLEDIKMVVSGAGASAIACSRFYVQLGIRKENILMCDSRGVVHGEREDLNELKKEFQLDTSARTLADALAGADLLLGLSRGGLVTGEMLETMADRPIIFALANPDPEIPYAEAKAARPDAIVATGRSDTDNQVNNVLGFPGIFRGALDVRATTINEEMKVAAAQALADLARLDVPDTVNAAYGESFAYGPDYIIPKPFDPRVLRWVAPAVAAAAVKSGVAQLEYDDEAYREHLRTLLGGSTAIMRKFVRRAQKDPRRLVFAEGQDPRILKACGILTDERIAFPVLLGDADAIAQTIAEHDINLTPDEFEVVNPLTDRRHAEYARLFHEKRRRKGVDSTLAKYLLERPNYFGMMMVQHGDADGIVSGLNYSYPQTIRPALQIIGLAPGVRRTAGMYLMLHKDGILFFGDTTVNLDADAETLADVGEMIADAAAAFEVEPRVAMLGYSNFGSNRGQTSQKVAAATAILHGRRPDLRVDGEMQANVALNYQLLSQNYPFTKLDGPANVLIFPNLESGNVAYKLMRELGSVPAVGPVLLGMARPVTVLERDSSVDAIVHMASLTVVQAQLRTQSHTQAALPFEE